MFSVISKNRKSILLSFFLGGQCGLGNMVNVQLETALDSACKSNIFHFKLYLMRLGFNDCDVYFLVEERDGAEYELKARQLRERLQTNLVQDYEELMFLKKWAEAKTMRGIIYSHLN